MAFTIYENAALDDPDGVAGNEAITFTSLVSSAYENGVNIAYETLELGDFSSDSLQDKPFTLPVIAVYAPTAGNVSPDEITIFGDSGSAMQAAANQAILTCQTQLETYLANTTLLTLISEPPALFQSFNNLKIISLNFAPVTALSKLLVANITFQQIRMTSLVSGLSSSQVSDPQNASATVAGYLQATTTSYNATLDVDSLNPTYINSNLTGT